MDCLYHETLSSILLDYGKALLSAGRRTESMQMNEDLYKMVAPRKLHNVYLYNEVVFQKLNLLWATEYNVTVTNNCGKENVDADVNCIGECKTPESKVTQVTFRKSCSPKYTSFCNKTIRPIPFSLGDVESDLVIKKREVSKQKACVTPIIKVEMHKSEAMNKTKKAVIPSKTKKDCSAINAVAGESGRSLAAPGSPNVCTPDSVKFSPVEKTLRKKTMLLTKKSKNQWLTKLKMLHRVLTILFVSQRNVVGCKLWLEKIWGVSCLNAKIGVKRKRRKESRSVLQEVAEQ